MSDMWTSSKCSTPGAGPNRGRKTAIACEGGSGALH